MDGLTCVRRIREMQRGGELNGHIPVIACTGNARREQINVSLEAGMVRIKPPGYLHTSLPFYSSMIVTHNFLPQDEVVTKPFRINELLPKMLKVIQRLKMNDIRRISTESAGSNGTGFSNTSAASTGSGYFTMASISGGSSKAEI